MSTEVATKTCRIIAYDANAQKANCNAMKVVDVVTATVSGDGHQEKKHAQVATSMSGYPTYMVGATGGQKSGLPVIFVPGYTGPQ